MRCLITGSEGFIGKHLINHLKEKYEIMGFDRNINNENLLNLGAISLAFVKFNPEIVIHLASNISNDITLCHDDITSILNLLWACKEKGIKKFIFTSSAAVYGDSYPKTIPINPYGITKLQCEQWCKYYSELGLKTIILRLSNVYGKGGKGVINQFIEKTKNSERLTINGNGYQIRDFIYIDDVIQVIDQCINSDINNDILNVSTNIGSTIWDILKVLYETTSQHIELTFESEIINEIKISKLDSSDLIMLKFFDMNEFKSFISLKEGIAKLWNEK